MSDRAELDLVEVFAFGAHGWEDVEAGGRASRTVKALRVALEKAHAETDAARADTALLDFLEHFKGNLWIDGGRWTLFVRVGGRDSLPLQPTGDTLRGVLRNAMAAAEGKVPVWRKP